VSEIGKPATRTFRRLILRSHVPSTLNSGECKGTSAGRLVLSHIARVLAETLPACPRLGDGEVKTGNPVSVVQPGDTGISLSTASVLLGYVKGGQDIRTRKGLLGKLLTCKPKLSRLRPKWWGTRPPFHHPQCECTRS